MKRYKRLLILVTITILILYYLVPVLQQKGRSWVQRYQGGMHSSSDAVSSSLVYMVKSGQWLTFNIPDGSQQLKMLSNGHIRNPDGVTEEDSWKYILRYQLMDKNDKLILDEKHYHHSKLSTFIDQQGSLIFRNYYSGYQYTPLDGRVMLLSMPAIQKAKKVRISFIPQNTELVEAAIRFYAPVKISSQKLATQWLRKSKKLKETLANNTVYSANLLTTREKRNLLKHQWQALGPVGIKGKDFIPKTLYMFEELVPQKLDDEIVAEGVQLDAEHPGIIAIPEHGGRLGLKLTGLDGSQLSSPVMLQLSWFGRKRDQRWYRDEQWLPDSSELNYRVQGGLLQINAQEPVLVRAFLNTEDEQSFEITPKPQTITTYSVSHGVDYQVLHVNNQPTSLRIDIRRVFDQAIPDSSSTITYQWLNNQKQIIDSGILAAQQYKPSIYDRLTGKQKALKVSDSVSYYFNVPSEVSQVKLISQDLDLLVNVYNQPYQYQKKQRIPENSFVSIDKEHWFPSWFQLRPGNEAALIKQKGVSRIAAQYRPPEENPAFITNQYQWQDYRPQGQIEARFILSEMDSLDYRDEALASVYCQLPLNQLNHHQLKAYGNLTQLSPQLIFIRSQKSPFDISVFVDQRLTLETQAIGQQGVLRLSNLSSGSHSFKLKSKAGGQWLMNYVSTCKSKAFLKKRVYKLRGKQLTFIYNNEQRGNKVFAGRFFTESGNHKRSLIQVSIESLQKQPLHKRQESWTYNRRSYDIRPPQGQSSIVLNSHGYYLNGGESFFIPFNHDMPIGQYQIKITLKQGAPGYLALSSVNPGLYEQWQFYRETNDQNN